MGRGNEKQKNPEKRTEEREMDETRGGEGKGESPFMATIVNQNVY